MNNENFSTLELLYKQFKYPFPTLKTPHAEQLQEIIENQWIDGEYPWLYGQNPDLRKKYKKTKTAHIAVQWFPTASIERFKPICRLMMTFTKKVMLRILDMYTPNPLQYLMGRSALPIREYL